MRTCEHCGSTLAAADAADGTCLRCLLELGLGEDERAGEGERIGPYRLVRMLGEGGMGVVYLASQEEPLRRDVALKLIKLGMDTRQVIARFEAERQMLAFMNHPHVAKVHDAGISEDGRPYFVMEYVPGVPITEYCEEHDLKVAERLELVIQACSALQHAHQKGIIHRDVKPSNILVAVEDGRPRVKVIDFGVARATGLHGQESSRVTRDGTRVGTPEYMSPEQAGIGDIDARTDIYSLGLVLYELVAGTLPFAPTDPRKGRAAELQRLLREKSPPAPSSRLTRRKGARAARHLQGDLDWITLRAIDRDRERRYASVHELAEDLRRHLRDEPVQAGPPGVGYRLRKFTRRNKQWVAVGVAAVLLLVGFALTMALQAARTARERDRADRVAAFMGEIFRVSDPSESRGNAVTARELLDRGAERVRTDLADEPRLQADMMFTMASVYRGLGLFGEAAGLAESTIALRRGLLGDEHADTLEAIHLLGGTLYDQGSYDEAEPYMREVLAGKRRQLGDADPGTLRILNDFSVLMMAQGKPDEAEGPAREVLETRRRTLGDRNVDTLVSLNSVAAILHMQGRLDEAVPFYREALDGRRQVLGPDHPETLTLANNLCYVLRQMGQLHQAEELCREALDGRRRVLGDEHLMTVTTMGNMGELAADLGDHTEAEALFREAAEIARRTLPAPHVVTGATLQKLGVCLAATGRYDDAEQTLKEAEAILSASVGESHPRTLRARADLESVEKARKKPL